MKFVRIVMEMHVWGSCWPAAEGQERSGKFDNSFATVGLVGGVLAFFLPLSVAACSIMSSFVRVPRAALSRA